MEEIYSIELHKSLQINGINITRVPGGWWYSKKDGNIFVPFDNEFQYSTLKFSLNQNQIITAVSTYYYNHYFLPKDFHLRKTRNPLEVEGKQMIVKLLKDLLELKQVDIAKILRYKERSTITTALKKINQKLEDNVKTRERYRFIFQELHKLNKN